MTVLLAIGGIIGWLIVGYLTARFTIWFDKKDKYQVISVGQAYLFTFLGPIVTILLVVYFLVMLLREIANMTHGHFKNITA